MSAAAALKRIAVIPGDGVGPEVTDVAVSCIQTALQRTGGALEMDRFGLGAEHYLKTGVALPDEVLEKLKGYDAVLFGAIGDPRVPPGVLEKGILLKLRFDLDLFVNLRPIKLLSEDLCPLKGTGPADVDFVVVRENTEGAYVGAGGVIREGTEEEVAFQEDVNTYKGVIRVLDYAFNLARQRRGELVMADKSNVLTYAHGLWRRLFDKKKAEYPDVAGRHMYIDTLCMEMIRKPSQFDVIVTSNLFGDIITDLGAQLQGGMGMAASGNVHPGRVSMFEPVHGSAPDLAGQGMANPFASVLSGAMLLEHLGLTAQARLLEEAVAQAVTQGVRTRDIGGERTTIEAGSFLCHTILETGG